MFLLPLLFDWENCGKWLWKIYVVFARALWLWPSAFGVVVAGRLASCCAKCRVRTECFWPGQHTVDSRVARVAAAAAEAGKFSALWQPCHMRALLLPAFPTRIFVFSVALWKAARLGHNRAQAKGPKLNTKLRPHDALNILPNHPLSSSAPRSNSSFSSFPELF